jgi:hypothetical protein
MIIQIPTKQTLHDIQIENIQYNHEFAIDTNLDVKIIIKRIILYRLLYLLLLSSLIFIIYEYNDSISFYLSKISNIF